MKNKFKKECLQLFPKFIKVDDLYYMQVAITTVSNLYEFCYVAFDGNFCNWKLPVLCDLKNEDYKEILLQIKNFLLTTPHKVVEEVLTKEEQLHRELAILLNKYSCEHLGGNTPDYILASYLINCLRIFGHTTNNRTEWYKDGN